MAHHPLTPSLSLFPSRSRSPSPFRSLFQSSQSPSQRSLRLRTTMRTSQWLVQQL